MVQIGHLDTNIDKIRIENRELLTKLESDWPDPEVLFRYKFVKMLRGGMKLWEVKEKEWV